MFSTTTTTPTPGSKAIAANALRSAGLIDKDTQMRDASDKPGGRKGSSKKSRSHRNLPIDAFKSNGPGSGSRMLASTRLSTSASHAGTSDPLAIRGAARPTATGRLRRNALSNGTSTSTTGPRVTIRPTVKLQTIESWRELVRKRWNPEAKFLNLESLIDDDLVKKYDLKTPGTGGGSARDAAVIFKLAAELKPPVQTLSLANNQMVGEHLQYLAKYLPQLANLSLQNNNLRHWKDLDVISTRKGQLKHLRELILVGNPVRELEFKNGRGDRYKQELTRRFTSLEVLDTEAISQISFDAPQPSTSIPVKKPDATTFPFQMGASFVTGVPDGIVPNFLIRFFNLFDNDRSGLVHAYDPQATFSYSVNTTIPSRARVQAFHYSKEMPNQRKLEWTPWLTGGDGGSRNLARISGGLQKTVKSLHIGGEAAVKALQGLPSTRHDIGGPPEKFCLDGYPVPVGSGTGLLITLHGEFTEVGTEGVRSFDRSFVLAPAAEGSPTKLNGWDVVILSDQWIVRVYSSHGAWKPGPMLVQAVPKTEKSAAAAVEAQLQQYMSSLPAEQQSSLATIPDAQRLLVLEIMRQTNLNAKFAVDCLQGNEWNLERAIVNFNEVKNTLGRDAYL